MPIRFITGNKNKFEEVRTILGIPLEQAEIDLPEIQSLDAHEVMKHKLLAAEKHAQGEYIVEDTSLYLSCLKNQLPGPFIKWFEKSIGISGIVELAQKMDDDKARAVSLLGYINSKGEIKIVEGGVEGRIVDARGDKDFGWGPIFEPQGHAKTFGEMERSEKHSLSMRGIAAKKLAEFLAG